MAALTSDERGVVLPCPRCGQANRVPYERLGTQPRCAKCATTLPLPAQPVEVSSDAAFRALTDRSALPVLVDFWAEWCGPCKMVAPELVKVAAAGAGRWLVAKVNTEHVPGPAQEFQIRAIPTLVLFRAGHELGRQAGAMPASGIQDFIARHLAAAAG